RITGSPPAPKGPAGPRDKNKKPLAHTLTYKIDASGELTSVVALIDSFNQAPLLHQVKSASIKPAKTDARRPSTERLVELSMTVEALVVDGAEKRVALLPSDQRLLAVGALTALRGGPSGLALVPLGVDQGLLKPKPLVPASAPGQYAYIARKN